MRSSHTCARSRSPPGCSHASATTIATAASACDGAGNAASRSRAASAPRPTRLPAATTRRATSTERPRLAVQREAALRIGRGPGEQRLGPALVVAEVPVVGGEAAPAVHVAVVGGGAQLALEDGHVAALVRDLGEPEVDAGALAAALG